VVVALCLTPGAHGQVKYELVKGFDARFLDGADPWTLIQAADGSFFGTTRQGGAFGFGTIFKIDASGLFSTLHQFTGGADGAFAGGLIQAADGDFYGTTITGSTGDGGTVFKMTAAGTLTTLHTFTGSEGRGADWGVIQGADGAFYGVTQTGGSDSRGTVFKMTAAGVFSTLTSFAGTMISQPSAGLMQAADGFLYGVTMHGGSPDNGALFKLDPVAGNVTTFHAFSFLEGKYPASALIEAADGTFWGMAFSGGASNLGTVFKITPAGVFSVLHSFAGADGRYPSSALMQAADGSFYATLGSGPLDAGTVVRIDGAGNVTALHVFSDQARAGVIQGSDGALYGATQGGTGGVGTGIGQVFRLDSLGSVTTLHSFTTGNAPSSVTSAIIQGGDGAFYGTTVHGGTSDSGTVFEVDSAGVLTTLHSFMPTTGGPEGAFPSAGLFQGGDGSFFGTTPSGGTASGGTVFKRNPAGVLTTVHSLVGSVDGSAPSGGVVQATDGNLYGTATGGASGYGSVFRVNPASGALTRLHAFAGGADGIYPVAGVIQGSDGSFYGTTAFGGIGNRGTVFKIDADGSFTTLHRFSSSFDGANPYGPLAEGVDGSLYGTTMGPSGHGTIFKIDPSGGFSTVHRFPGGIKGGAPQTGLFRADDGSFYGTTSVGGAYGAGTVFRLDPSGTVATMYQFTGKTDGSYPGRVIVASDGKLYGTTPSGGPTGGGTLFRLSVTPVAVSLTRPELSGCVKTTATIRLSSPAPPGGLVVTLTSDNVHAVVPATAWIPAGALGKKVELTTTAVASVETATIGASIFGVAGPGQVLTIDPMKVTAVSLAPTSVVGGLPVSGMVTLECPAGPGDVLVALSSTNAAAAYPGSPTVSVPAGMKTASFSVTTLPVTTKTTVWIRAAANGVTKSRTLTVTPGS
jgi:uncharacterized repeat protein (TIGR03803 family)